MTINPVDMQVLVPRAGEVERVNRTTQGQQQTDQQIMSQLLQDNLKQKEKSVQQMLPAEQNKIQDERKEKNKNKSKKKQQKDAAALSPKEAEKELSDQNQDKDQDQDATNTGRFLDIKI